MIEFSKSEAGNVGVVTTSNGGLSTDHWAERATNTIARQQRLQSLSSLIILIWQKF